MTVNATLRKKLDEAEKRSKPKDPGNLQQRIEAYSAQFEAGEDDGLLSEYPASLFEPTPEPLHKKPVDGVSEAEPVNDTPTGRTAVYGHSDKDFEPTPLDFGYIELKPGWTEKVEKLPDGSEIRHVHLDLTQIDLDEPDELDRPSWDLGVKPPSYEEVKRSIMDL